jgi:hypothetical protein
MFSRLFFLLVVLFWLTMNFLLWRSEFGQKTTVGSPVALDTVFNKVLTAPDVSSLEIYHHGKKIGFCRWTASVGTEASKRFSEEFRPEGMIEQATSYSLDLEGNLTPAGTTNRLRFDLNLKLSTNRVWEEFSVRANMRPDTWELRANAVDQKVSLVMDDSYDRLEQSFTFADLQNPQTLLREFGGPYALALLGGLGNFGLDNIGKTNSASAVSALKWEANNDSMRFGHSKVRVYRLKAKLFDRFEIFVFVSRVGEILWIELPDKIVLSNDAFTHF